MSPYTYNSNKLVICVFVRLVQLVALVEGPGQHERAAQLTCLFLMWMHCRHC